MLDDSITDERKRRDGKLQREFRPRGKGKRERKRERERESKITAFHGISARLKAAALSSRTVGNNTILLSQRGKDSPGTGWKRGASV